jgi:hypothetical protein
MREVMVKPHGRVSQASQPCVSTGKRTIMNEKYKNRYRTTSHRLPGWDYSGNGYYFITLITQNRECHLGKIVETHGRASLPIRKPKSISSFVGGFKSIINSKIDDYVDEHNLNIPKYNRNNHFFQPNYHDHIIRNENEYNRIAQYIVDNPIKWENDKLNGGDGNIVMEPIAEYNSEIWMI